MDTNGQVPDSPDAPEVLREIARNIADAASWLRLMAILGFMGAGFLAVAGIAYAFSVFPTSGGYGRFLGISYLIVAGVYLIPLIPLNRSASFASRLKTAISHEAAIQSLRSQAVFWRRMGILTVITLVLSVVFFVVVTIALTRSPSF